MPRPIDEAPARRWKLLGDGVTEVRDAHIIFRAPRFSTIPATEPGDGLLTVYHDGVPIQENAALPTPTTDAPDSDPANPVHFRNIQVVEMKG